MTGAKKNILILFYLVTVLGFGISSIFIGRAVADRQREILPEETKATEEYECSRHCRWEHDDKYCPQKEPGDEGEELNWCTTCQGACNKKKAGSCETERGEYMCDDCWVPACAESTPTPTPTNTPTPPPGCWGTCTKTSECSQTPIALVCQPVQGASHCVNPACPSQKTCQCPALICQDLTSDKDVSSLKEGDKIKLTCTGDAGVDQPLNHVKFRAQIDSGSWLDLGTASGPGFAVDYTIPQTGNYQIECRVCTSTDDSVCTDWGQAGVSSP